VRLSTLLRLLLLLLSGAIIAVAQSPNGTISGIVLDISSRAISGADIQLVNDATGVKYPGATNNEGIYAVRNLPPGAYRLQVSKIGFKTLIKPDIVLNTQDALAINFTLPVGAASETITVEAGAPLVNTESGAVGTVIDHDLIENLPLNGRSFNSLLQLTPGVTIAPSGSSNQGQFSISGQRTSSNNFLVDGVSANFGVAATFGLGTSGTGSAQAFSALGGTSSLVSVEALQEFRIETSSFAPEFGRSAGGQVLLTTRSGTNALHGGVYEYFRNDVLDANDWFANHANQPRAAERHNDFGAFLGGPILRDKTFFFASYEGVRLRQPNTTIVQVPSAYARSIASSALAPFLNAYPLPDNKTIVPGIYTGSFTGNYSNPSTLNAGSIRLDHNFTDRVSTFARYNEAPSDNASRNNALSEMDTTSINTRTVTVGATFTPSPRMSNAFRANYSLQRSTYLLTLDSFGGAAPPSAALLGPGLGSASQNTLLQFYTSDTAFYATGPSAKNRNVQWNPADDFSITLGQHMVKVGVDYRQTHLDLHPFQDSIEYIANSVSGLLSTGQATIYTSAARPSSFLTRATGLYAQDTWKMTPRFTLTYGLRWEINPAPEAANGTRLAALSTLSDLSALTIAPTGTPLWKTGYRNFGPRVGAAYSLTPKGDLVVRAGWGIFYDSASDAVGMLGASFPNTAINCCSTVSLPLSDVSPYLASLSSQPPYPSGLRAYSPGVTLPRSYQWNFAVEKSFAGSQALSLTYVGQAGRNILKQVGILQPNASFSGVLLLTENAAKSNYHALQVQYRKPMSSRIQLLLNYSWAHTLDNASNDTLTTVSPTVVLAANDYASSSFDVRHSFSGAVIYAVPNLRGRNVLALLARDWSLNGMIVARSGFPLNASVLTSTIAGAYPRPDRVSGQPVWISDSSAGGGKRLNPAAFSTPSSGQQGTEPRNDIPGFGLTQVDVSLVRKIAIRDRVNVQFRTDAFNILNHPNFQNPYAYVGIGNTYLQSTSMLNKGLGGLNPLFQQGGPRSLQLSFRVSF